MDAWEDIHRESGTLSQDDLQRALETAMMAVWIWNLDTGAVVASDSIHKLYGVVHGTPIQTHQQRLKLVHPADRLRYESRVESSLRSGEGWQAEFRVIRPTDGAVAWLEERARLTKDAAGERKLKGEIKEITAQKHAEAHFRTSEKQLKATRSILSERVRELEDTNRTAERARAALLNVLEDSLTAQREADKARETSEAAGRAKDQFLAVVSHELRAPLTPIRLAAQTLARHKAVPEVVREGLAMIERNVRIEAQLVDDLLDVTRIARGKLEVVLASMDMHEAVQDAVEISRPDLEEKNQRLTLRLEAPRHHSSGDKARLRQAIWNLLKNASKFTPEGGSIVVRTWNESNCILVEVSDDGIGIDGEALPRIFDAFSQADSSIARRFGGLGLGLAITNAIIKAHGGSLQARSAGPNQGAAFVLSSPLGTDADETRQAQIGNQPRDV